MSAWLVCMQEVFSFIQGMLFFFPSPNRSLRSLVPHWKIIAAAHTYRHVSGLKAKCPSYQRQHLTIRCSMATTEMGEEEWKKREKEIRRDLRKWWDKPERNNWRWKKRQSLKWCLIWSLICFLTESNYKDFWVTIRSSPWSHFGGKTRLIISVYFINARIARNGRSIKIVWFIQSVIGWLK